MRRIRILFLIAIAGILLILWVMFLAENRPRRSGGERGRASPAPQVETSACNRHTFSQYLVSGEDLHDAPPPPIQFTEAVPEDLRPLITETADKPSDFAGHYVVAGWGCGETCQRHAIVDARDGTITAFGVESQYGVDYKPTSRLLILNPLENLPVEQSRLVETQFLVLNEKAQRLDLVCQEKL